MSTTTSGVKGHFTGFIYTVLRHHISDLINHRSFYQISEILQNVEILLPQVNSVARLKIPWPTKTCGPY